MKQYNENGRSMIEMLGVLAIIGVLSVGGIMGYSKAMMRYKINKTIEQITYIAGNVRTTFASQGNYAGVSDSEIWRKAHLFPDEIMKDGYPITFWMMNFLYFLIRKTPAIQQITRPFPCV